MKTHHLILAACLVATAASAQELNWSTVASHPEFWPAHCTINKSVRFRSGATVSAGQQVDVLEVRGNQVILSTPDGRGSFSANADDTDALAVAKADWAKLTPKQRDLTYASLLQRKELWPYRATLTDNVQLGGNMNVRKGEKVILMNVEGNQLLVASERLNTSFDVEPRQTDFMAYARKAVEDKNGVPGRIVEEIQDKLINMKDGSKAPFEASATPRYLVFYRGAGWCQPCREFSPSLVKFYKDNKAAHPEFEIIFLSADHSEAEMRSYAKEGGFEWRSLTFEGAKKLPVVGAFTTETIPQLFVVDPGGKLLIDSAQVTRPVALQRLEALLKNPPAQN